MIPETKEHQYPEEIDLNSPRRAQYLHDAWKKHQDAVYWVDINLAIRKGLTFYHTRSNAIIFQGILPAYCIPKVMRLKTGEVLYEKSYMGSRSPPKISLRHDHDWTRGNVQMGSTVEQQPVGKLVQHSCGEVQHETFSQPTSNQNPNPICDRDRFIRDETFCDRMIENGRDEDACRQMDALADEDHTHHLTPQEYYN